MTKRKMFDLRVFVDIEGDISDADVVQDIKEQIAGHDGFDDDGIAVWGSDYSFKVRECQELFYKPETPELLRV